MIRRLTIGNIAYHNKKNEFLYNSLKKKKAKSTKSTSRSDVVNIITTRTTK